MSTAENLSAEVEVGMNSHAEIPSTGSIFTSGLCGCRCSIARHGDRVQLAHYDPLSTLTHLDALIDFKVEEYFLWVPGEWSKESGAWELKPNPVPPCFPSAKLIGYSEDIQHGDFRGVRYNAGEISAFNFPPIQFTKRS